MNGQNPKIKVCRKCGKVDGEVKFTHNKAVCNTCRTVGNKNYDLESGALFRLWKPRNSRIIRSFLAGVDPCEECIYTNCLACAVYQAKKCYLDFEDKKTREVLDTFMNDFKNSVKSNLARV